MRTPAIALLLLACSSHSPTPTATSEEVIVPKELALVTPDAAPPEPIVRERSLEPIVSPTPRHVVTGVPSRQMTTLAVTDDGNAAVSADLSGTARVWPTLDGKREPVVVAMRPPSALALTRVEGGLVIAALDAAGQLELIATKRTGEPVRRLAIEAERPFVSIHAVKGGFLALGDDRELAFVGADGTIGERLVTEPEEHLAAVTVRREHAIAMIETGGKVRARRIEVPDRQANAPLRWGETSPELKIRGEHVAITPDGERIVGMTGDTKRLRVVELATGRIERRLFEADFRDMRLRPIGYVDNDTLVFSDASQTIIWWSGDGTIHHDPVGHRDVPVVVGDGGAVVGSGGALAIAKSPAHAYEFVGYRMGGPLDLRAVDRHFVATDTYSVVELDERFRAVSVYELPKLKPAHSWYDVRVIDDRHVATSTYIDGNHALYVIDIVDNEVNLIAKQAYAMEWLPATKKLSYRTGNTIEVVELDPATSTFGNPTVIGIDNRSTLHFALLDPKHAEGNVAALVDFKDTTKAKVTLISKLNPVGVTMPYEVASEKDVELTERWWRTVGDITKLVDKSLLPSPWIKSPDGKLSAVLRNQRITLRDAKGERWTIPSHAATSLLWTPAGKLIAFGAGVAELDVRTGAIVTRQCGWRFGRWKEPVGFGPASLCEAP